MKKLIAGNWKMNGTADSARILAVDIAKGLTKDLDLAQSCDFLVAPPFVHIPLVIDSLSRNGGDFVSVAGQDAALHESGAYTGDISAAMLANIGCRYVILGHSERRAGHNEDSETIAEKAALAHKEGLFTIICVGETEKERDTGHETDVVAGQLARSLPGSATGQNTVIAYEPVWAIGTGKSATPDDIGRMHHFIREKLRERLEESDRSRILYGGSVKPNNAAEIFAVPDVGGALIGGASLDAGQFLDIARAAAEQE